MALARPGEGAVKLDAGVLRCAANEAAREQSEAAGAGGVTRARADHDRPDDVEQRYHKRTTLPYGEQDAAAAAGDTDPCTTFRPERPAPASPRRRWCRHDRHPRGQGR